MVFGDWRAYSGKANWDCSTSSKKDPGGRVGVLKEAEKGELTI